MQNLCAPPIQSLTSPPGIHWSFFSVSVVLLYPEYLIVGIIHDYFMLAFFRLVICIKDSSMYFYGFIAHFFLVLINMRCLDDITHLMDMSLSKLWELWWTGRPGALQSMGSQRVRHNCVTELNWMYVSMLLSAYIPPSPSSPNTVSIRLLSMSVSPVLSCMEDILMDSKFW